MYSLVNSGNIREAFNYSRKLEKKKLDTFESHLIIGIFHLKNSNTDLAQKYFLKAKNKRSRFILNIIKVGEQKKLIKKIFLENDTLVQTLVVLHLIKLQNYMLQKALRLKKFLK